MDKKIILLNGASSSGKSVIAKKFQEISSEPYLHTGIDYFMLMLPEKYLNVDKALLPPGYNDFGFAGGPKSTDGFWTGPIKNEQGEPSLDVKIGPVAVQLLKGMHNAFAAMAAQGNNLIIADVVTEFLMKSYVQALRNYNVILVGIHCPLKELERREQERGDRLRGSARLQLNAIEKPGIYDLELDTSKMDVLQCAEKIKGIVDSRERAGKIPDAFLKLQDKYLESHIYPMALYPQEGE